MAYKGRDRKRERARAGPGEDVAEGFLFVLAIFILFFCRLGRRHPDAAQLALILPNQPIVRLT